MAGDLNDIRKVVTDLEAEKNQALCLNQNLNEELCNLRKELCEHRRCEEKMREDLEETDNIIKNLRKENCQLEKCLQSKDCEICELRKLYTTIDELNAYICRLEKESECKTKQKNALEEQICELERCIQEKDCYIRRIENKINELEHTICEMEDEIKCLTDENECLKQELEECRRMVEKKTMELDCMCQRLKQCECEKQKLNCQIGQLQQALDDANDALQREQCNSCKLKEQLKRLQADNHKMCMDNSCLQEENCDLSKKLDTACKNLKKCQCEYERMQQDCQAFKRSIGEFKKQIVMDLKGPCGIEGMESSRCVNTKYGDRCRSTNYRKSLPRSCRPRCSDSFELNTKDSVTTPTYCERKTKKSGTCPAPQRCFGANSPGKKYGKSSTKKFGCQ